ncbi:hypothetical protein QR680_006821 [Steinernema hermaphroditum]|uniref:Uncharacterized protein n=1 Tax=Steinernema hermaphroditum TaxID=289476 RepID=A0AA39HYU0_9BILA|nr:hypothetical protein QR680_006821 [Steinernema hermaphroditum]
MSEEKKVSTLRKQMGLYELMNPGWFDVRQASLVRGDGPDFIQITERTEVVGTETPVCIHTHHGFDHLDKGDLVILCGVREKTARPAILSGVEASSQLLSDQEHRWMFNGVVNSPLVTPRPLYPSTPEAIRVLLPRDTQIRLRARLQIPAILQRVKDATDHVAKAVHEGEVRLPDVGVMTLDLVTKVDPAYPWLHSELSLGCAHTEVSLDPDWIVVNATDRASSRRGWLLTLRPKDSSQWSSHIKMIKKANLVFERRRAVCFRQTPIFATAHRIINELKDAMDTSR